MFPGTASIPAMASIVAQLTLALQLFAVAPSTHAAPIAVDDKTIAGFLDQPLDAHIANRETQFVGWAAGRHGIRSVEVIIDGRHRLATRMGIGREDVKNLLPDYPGSDKAGFELLANLGFLPLGSHEIEAVATDVMGNTKSLGKRIYVTDTFRDTWSDLLARRGRRPLDTFYYAFGTSNLGAPDSASMGPVYAPYVSDTVKAGVRVPILYLRTTKGRAGDWQFDPDFDTSRTCGEQVRRPITEDSLSVSIAWSIRTKIPILFTLNGGIWADASCDVPDWDINDELEKDRNNCQWNEQDDVYPDDYLKNLPGSQDAPELARALTLNVYAKDVRRYKKRNLQAASRAIASFAKKYPELFIGVSLDPDVYLNPFFEGLHWHDYNPSTLRQFREWLQGIGPYAGQPVDGAPDLSRYKRKKVFTLQELNDHTFKEYADWPGVSPGRTFSLSRTVLLTPLNALWEEFRRHLVDLHYDELSRWASEAGIPSTHIFSTQGFDAPHEVTGFEPFALRVDSPPKHFDSGGMSVEGAKPSRGHLGATLYGESAINNALMENGDSLFRGFRDLDPDWAVLEYNTSDVRGPKVLGDIVRGYRGVRDIVNYGARLLSPMAWNGSPGSSFGEPGFAPYTSYRGTPLEQAVRNAMVSRANLPRQARLWTFGGGLVTDDDDWYARVPGLAVPVDAALEVTIDDDGKTVIDSPNALDFRTSELDALILGIASPPPGLTIEVQARERNRRAWKPIVGRVKMGALERYRAGYLVPLPKSSQQQEQLRIIFRAMPHARVIIERIALYPVAMKNARDQSKSKSSLR